MEGVENTPPPVLHQPKKPRVKKWQNSWRRQRTVPTQSTEATSTVNFMSQWNQACTAIPSLLSFLNLFNILDATDMLQSNPSAILKNRRLSPHGTEHPPRYSWYLHVHHDIPHGTQDNPHGTQDIPHIIMISPTVLNTPTYSRYPPRYCTHIIQGDYGLSTCVQFFWKQFLAACLHKGGLHKGGQLCTL